MKTKNRILAGITHEDELYFLDIDRTNGSRNGYKEFTMSGNTNKPIRLEDAHTQVEESLRDGEIWRMEVEAKHTELGLEDWVQMVLDTDGNLSGFDNSLFPNTVTVNGEDWLFESRSCGQHEEETLKHYFINENLYKQLMKIWKRYHMKELPENSAMSIVEEALEIKQDFDALAKEAIELINKQD